MLRILTHSALLTHWTYYVDVILFQDFGRDDVTVMEKVYRCVLEMLLIGRNTT